MRWTEQASLQFAILRGLWGSSNTDVYGVGQNLAIFHYNGATWSDLSIYSDLAFDDFTAVGGSASNDVYLSSIGGDIYHSGNGGASWTRQTGVTGTIYTPAWSGVIGYGTGKVLAVGRNSMIARSTNGGVTVTVESSAGVAADTVSAVWRDAATGESYAVGKVGSGGAIWHIPSDTGAWTQLGGDLAAAAQRHQRHRPQRHLRRGRGWDNLPLQRRVDRQKPRCDRRLAAGGLDRDQGDGLRRRFDGHLQEGLIVAPFPSDRVAGGAAVVERLPQPAARRGIPIETADAAVADAGALPTSARPTSAPGRPPACTTARRCCSIGSIRSRVTSRRTAG